MFQSSTAHSIRPQPRRRAIRASSREQRPAGAAAALLRQHEEVFEIETRAPQEGREREVVDGQPDVGATPAADERLEVAASPEAVAADLLARGDHLLRQPLVLGEAADAAGR